MKGGYQGLSLSHRCHHFVRGNCTVIQRKGTFGIGQFKGQLPVEQQAVAGGGQAGCVQAQPDGRKGRVAGFCKGFGQVLIPMGLFIVAVDGIIALGELSVTMKSEICVCLLYTSQQKC